uniref:Chitin-binding type-2 domain-containing protein n=1 Tax=Aedes aegypti TaxID=7159 RepID=A0A6E8P816_AEDAE|nr:uncharacterized protein LOC125467758 precursor [Aedes aegypti]
MYSNALLPALVLILFSTSGFCQEVLGSAGSVCSNVSFGILPHPTNCQLYYVCVNFKGSVHQCGYNFVFDPRVSFCVHHSMYQCSETVEPTSSPPTEAPSTTNVPELPSTPSDCPETAWETLFCRNRVSTLIHNPFNCTQYINCELYPPSNRVCPSGKVFSLPYQDCFPGDPGRCLLQPVDPRFCETRPPGNYPHPYRCNQFVTCFQNSTRVESCPPYYVFDLQTVRCVRGNVLQCSSLLSEV